MKNESIRHSDEGRIQISQSIEHGSFVTRNDGNEDPLLTILGEIRAGKVTTRSLALLESRNIRVETEDHTELFTRNVSVDAYNTERLNAIRDDIFIFDMHSKGSLPLVEALKK